MDFNSQENEDFKQSPIYKGIKYFEQLEWSLAHEQFQLATQTQYVELANLFLYQTSILLDKIIEIKETDDCFCDEKPKKLLKILNELSLKFNEDNNIVIQCTKVLIEDLIKSTDDSRVAFEQIVQQFPNHFLPYFYSGNFYFSADNYLKAMEDFDKAIALCPYIPILFHNKGRCLQKLEKFEEALDCFNKALAIQKNYLFYQEKLEVLTSLEKNMEGLALCDCILQIKRNETEIYDKKGVNFQKLGDFRNALICYRIFESFNQNSESQLDPGQLQQNL